MTKQNMNDGMNSDLLVKYLVGEADQTEINAAETWVSISTENDKELQDIAFILSHSSLEVPPAVDKASEWESLHDKISASLSGLIYRTIAWTIGIAASIAVLVVLKTINDRHARAKINDLTIGEFHIASGESALHKQLPDGSVINMDSHSAIDYNPNFNCHERRISFRGSAFFSIAHNSAKPFIIDVNDITVTVVGTSFSIHSSPTNTEIIVSSGVVRVKKNTDSVQLIHEQRIVVRSTDSSLRASVISAQSPGKDSIHSSLHKTSISNTVQAGDPIKQKQLIRKIINELLNHHCVQRRSDLVSFSLNNSGLYINDRKQPVQQAIFFQQKYLDKKGNGFYVGPAKQTGKGFVFTMQEVEEK